MYVCIPGVSNRTKSNKKRLKIVVVVVKKKKSQTPLERLLFDCVGQSNIIEHLIEGDVELFDFTILVIFEIGFSAFALKMSGFSVFLSVVVFGFFFFKHPVFGF